MRSIKIEFASNNVLYYWFKDIQFEIQVMLGESSQEKVTKLNWPYEWIAPFIFDDMNFGSTHNGYNMPLWDCKE